MVAVVFRHIVRYALNRFRRGFYDRRPSAVGSFFQKSRGSHLSSEKNISKGKLFFFFCVSWDKRSLRSSSALRAGGRITYQKMRYNFFFFFFESEYIRPKRNLSLVKLRIIFSENGRK